MIMFSISLVPAPKKAGIEADMDIHFFLEKNLKKLCNLCGCCRVLSAVSGKHADIGGIPKKHDKGIANSVEMMYTTLVCYLPR